MFFISYIFKLLQQKINKNRYAAILLFHLNK